jgi:hypothetical protein
MTAVVHSLHERQALDWAIQFFRDRVHELTTEGSKQSLHDAVTGVLLDAHYVYDYTREERGKIYTQLVDGAQHGNSFAVQQLLKFAATLIEKGEPLPEEMRGAVAELLRNPPKVKNKRGPGPFTLKARGSAIIEADERGVNQSWQRGNNRALVMCRPNNSGSFAIFAAIRRSATSPNWQSGKLEEGRTQGQFRAAQVPR